MIVNVKIFISKLVSKTLPTEGGFVQDTKYIQPTVLFDSLDMRQLNHFSCIQCIELLARISVEKLLFLFSWFDCVRHNHFKIPLTIKLVQKFA